jgi:Cytoplasmic Fragile-X interacting family
MKETGVEDDWGRQFSSAALDRESSQEFFCVFSALSFVYFSDKMTDNTPSALVIPPTVNEESFTVSNEDEFGHGFALAGCTFLHLLQQREKFVLLDFSYHVLNVYMYECKSIDPSREGYGATPSQNAEAIEERNSFVVNAQYERLVQQEAFAILETICPFSSTHSPVLFRPSGGTDLN